VASSLLLSFERQTISTKVDFFPLEDRIDSLCLTSHIPFIPPPLLTPSQQYYLFTDPFLHSIKDGDLIGITGWSPFPFPPVVRATPARQI